MMDWKAPVRTKSLDSIHRDIHQCYSGTYSNPQKPCPAIQDLDLLPHLQIPPPCLYHCTLLVSSRPISTDPRPRRPLILR